MLDRLTSIVADTGGITRAQLSIGRVSLVIDVFGMKTDAQFVNTLEDVI